MKLIKRMSYGYRHDHNYIQPHWALELKTPIEYYVQWKKIHKAKVSAMS
ncbi:MAG TPA: hypothetical protein PLQ25_05605 [Candidatus Saccharicenans sp.]|nr:hypothetical protein [Candidatus Saccharicenans sp.]